MTDSVSFLTLFLLGFFGGGHCVGMCGGLSSAFALQLPLRVLVTETDGKVRAVYTDTHALIAGSRISFDEVANTLANAEKLIQKTVGE